MKQAIIFRKDLKLSIGKSVAQACHASIGAYLNTPAQDQVAWKSEGEATITLQVADQKKLVSLFQAAKDAGLPAVLIKDAGRTEIAPGTITCIGIGPAPDERIDQFIGDLKLLQ